MDKRRHPDAEMAMVAAPAKRSKGAIVEHAGSRGSKALVATGPPRSSNLMAPVMELTGHGGEVFACDFSASGNQFATGGFDRKLFIWNTYGECENIAALPGHTNAILDLAWASEGFNIYTCSSDKTVCIWDGQICDRLRKLKGHTDFVNSVSGARNGSNLIVSGSDDCSVKIWDSRRRGCVHSLKSSFQVTAVSFGHDDGEVISGGLDNDLKIWDLRKLDIIHTLRGHTDTITSVSLSPDGKSAVSNAMDNTVRVWDVQPFAAGQRQLRVLQGAQHNFEKNLLRAKFSADGKHIASGSADRNVHVWNTLSGRTVYCLPGHKGSVNDVAFHPKEPILLSASSDKKVFLGELHV